MMVGANDAMFGNKRRSGNMEVGNKKGDEAEGRERMGGGQKQQSCHECQFLPEGHFMTSIPGPTFCASI